jgi:ABC-type antimicrobial peptide transport system permease subunit
MTFAVRTTGDPAPLIAPIRQTLARLDSNVPIYDVHTQKEWIDINVSRESDLASTLSFYGLVAVLLAGIGVYGTLAFLVNGRTSEIGIRAALGARRRQLIGLVISESVIPVGLGVALGLGGSLLFASRIRAMLFRTSPDDPLTILGATSCIVVSALLAAYLPARRAARVDPMRALRYE